MLSNLFLKFHTWRKMCKLSKILYDRNIKYMKHSQLLDVVIHILVTVYICAQKDNKLIFAFFYNL